MRRTAGRALPSGRLAPSEAVVFGGLLAVLGTSVLLWGANRLAAAVALVTFVLYVFVYTPLKTRHQLNTVIGADPGRLAAGDRLGGRDRPAGHGGVGLFLIVFLWQFPHFLAIAWIYRDDYERAGFRMLTLRRSRAGRMTGCQAVSYALALVPAGLLPAMVGLAGPVYFAGAAVLGLVYLVAAARFWLDVSDRRARRLLRTSFVYLPAILLLLVLNPAAVLTSRTGRPSPCLLSSCSEGRYHDGNRHPQLDRDRSRPAWPGHAPSSTRARVTPARSPCGSSWPRK